MLFLFRLNLMAHNMNITWQVISKLSTFWPVFQIMSPTASFFLHQLLLACSGAAKWKIFYIYYEQKCSLFSSHLFLVSCNEKPHTNKIFYFSTFSSHFKNILCILFLDVLCIILYVLLHTKVQFIIIHNFIICCHKCRRGIWV